MSEEGTPLKSGGCESEDDSESDSDYDEGEFHPPDPPERPKEWHNDHWDEVVEYYNPYAECIYPGEDWISTHIDEAEYSVSNEKLSTEPITQHWLQILSGLQYQSLPSIRFTVDPTCASLPGGVRRFPIIPLFKDDNTGDEYQLQLDLSSSLSRIWCPVVNPQSNLPIKTHPLILVRYRLPQPEPKSAGIDHQEDSRPSQLLLPHYFRPLGTLAIRNTARYPDYTLGREPLTEPTDYNVMLDVGSESLSVWLVCSRRRLRDRAHEEQGIVYPVFPIFKGQMLESEDGNGDGYGYDVACIMESVRQIGSWSFEEACELVGRTRAIADPGRLLGLLLESKWREIQSCQ